MANESETQDPRDARIAQLEAELKSASGKLDLQRKRAEKLEAMLRTQKSESLPIRSGFEVRVDGVEYHVLGDFRADNTFAEVKRGHCPEGVTLVAIDKPH